MRALLPDDGFKDSPEDRWCEIVCISDVHSLDGFDWIPALVAHRLCVPAAQAGPIRHRSAGGGKPGRRGNAVGFYRGSDSTQKPLGGSRCEFILAGQCAPPGRQAHYAEIRTRSATSATD